MPQPLVYLAARNGLLAAGLLLAGGAGAATYDLQADWSDATNPNGPWTYRQGGSALPSVPDWTPISNADPAYGAPAGGGAHIAQPAWAPSAIGGDFLPAWFRAAVTPSSAGLEWLAGDIVVHTTDSSNGAAQGIASVLWTAPNAGLLDIAGGIWDARTNLSREQDWELYVDGALVDSGHLLGALDAISRATPDTIGFNGSIGAGEIVELRIFRQASEDFGDFVGVNLTLELTCRGDCPPVPEPAALALLGFGALGVIGSACRRRRGATS